MKPKIISKKDLHLIGCVFYGDPFHSAKGWDTANEIGKLWAKFNELMQKNKKKIQKYLVDPDISYEVHIDPEVSKEENKWYIFVGKEVENLEVMPLQMFHKILPKTRYAVFTSKGNNYLQANDVIYKEWLPDSNFDESFSFQIQVYDSKRYFGLDNEESEIDFYIPIK